MKKQLRNKIAILAFGTVLTFTNTLPSFALDSVTSSTSTTTTTAVDQNLLYQQKADAVIKTAMGLIGKATYDRYNYQPFAPYKFGCSGFIYYSFLQNGIDLNTRNTDFQAELGVPVAKDQLQKGDIVFFDSTPGDSDPYTHNGIYIGDNKIIHMADAVKNVTISDLNSTSYYRNYYVGARRIIPSYMPPAVLTQGDKIAATAETLVGKTTWGTYNESTLTFNNGGFAYYVYKKNGIDLQTKYVSQLALKGQAVAKDQLKKGDMVFFGTDTSPGKPILVGIYDGNFNVVINSGSSTGTVKRFMLIDYYAKHYVTARRIVQ